MQCKLVKIELQREEDAENQQKGYEAEETKRTGFLIQSFHSTQGEKVAEVWILKQKAFQEKRLLVTYKREKKIMERG